MTLIFVHDQAENFLNSILQLEGDCVFAVDAVNIINALKTTIETRMENKYFSLEFRAASDKISKKDLRQKRTLVDTLIIALDADRSII